MLSLFMMPMPGMPASDVEKDAREGGKFTIMMHAGDDKLPHTGEYIEINRPDKLVFTWGSHSSVDNSTVTLNFTKIEDNKTVFHYLMLRLSMKKHVRTTRADGVTF